MNSKQINPKKYTPKHIIVKLLKTEDKEKVLKATKEKFCAYRGKVIQMTVTFTSEIVQARRK